MDRDENAARIILSRGLGTIGHIGTFMLDMSKASGEMTSTLAGAIRQSKSPHREKNPCAIALGSVNYSLGTLGYRSRKIFCANLTHEKLLSRFFDS